MNGEYQLVPHVHSISPSSCQEDIFNVAWSTSTSPASLGLQKSILVCVNEPIGRMELISAVLNTCDSRNSCPICSQISSAARFLSKEMMTFTLESNAAGKDSIKLVIQKCGKLIRINHNRIQQEESIDITNGSIISVFLPNDPEKGSINEKNTDSRLSIQFTFFSKEEAKLKHEDSRYVSKEETRRKEKHTPIHEQVAPESPNKSLEGDQEEASPTLTMPHYLNFETSGQSNSFESSISGGLLTLQESTSDWSSQKVNQIAPAKNRGVLLSSLTTVQLQKLIDNCEDSEKGKFRKNVLEMALENNPLPVLLRSTRINMKENDS